MDGDSVLVVELAQQRHAARDPVLSWSVGRNLDGQHEVGRVAGGRQRSASLARLVHGRLVHLLLRDVRALHWNQPNLKATTNDNTC